VEEWERRTGHCIRGVLVGAVAAIVGVALVIKAINKRKAKQVEAVEVDDYVVVNDTVTRVV
jgi:hypothetical protein